jgi:hypothetical protein
MKKIFTGCFMVFLLVGFMAGCGTWDSGGSTGTTPPTVISINPADVATGVCINREINATFSKAMDPATITTATFTVTGPGTTPVAGTVTYNATTNTATFTATADLAASTTFTATIHGGASGVKDTAGNAFPSNKVWTFTTGTGACLPPVALGAAAPFGIFGSGAGMTNSGLLTVINGDIGTTGVSTTVTGFHDITDNYTVTGLNNGAVNGTVYSAAPPPGTPARAVIAAAAAADALTAYNTIQSMPDAQFTVIPANLSGQTLPPGKYQAAGAGGGALLLTGSDLTLDGQGDNIGAAGPLGSRSINFVNGGQPKNVFWQVGSSATINPAGLGGTIVGTILANTAITFSTDGVLGPVTTLNGRALALTAAVTTNNTVINVPAP